MPDREPSIMKKTDPDLLAAREIAAKHWYKGVPAAVLAGNYDENGDVVKICLIAVKRGREMEKSS